ncbi:MAG: type II secretion system GspH family protein [Candidatus Uhrbacteria bacterium]|nr:type II secretion system GspH family protein [Candidatus Uhrbacteria bacterium]
MRSASLPHTRRSPKKSARESRSRKGSFAFRAIARKIHERAQAFTLIELMIYTAITASMMAAIVFTTKTMYDARARVRTAAIVHEQVRFILDRVTATVRESETVTFPSAGSASSSLSVTVSGNTYAFRLAQGRMYLKEGSAQELPLTSNEMLISSATFTRSNTNPPIIRIQVSGDVRNANGAYEYPFTLTGSASVRREQ